MGKIKVLDMFSGGHTVSTPFRSLGMDVTTVDLLPDADISINILDKKALSLIEKEGPFDFIWASPPCECYSVASMGHHWIASGKPKTEKAKEALLILETTLHIINQLMPAYWLLENPMGMMRKVFPLRYIPRTTITYCQYGDNRMKPTDIFGYAPPNWKPRPRCFNNNKCHPPTPAGSKTGTQGRKTYLERSQIPEQLLIEIGQSLLKSDFKRESNPHFIVRKKKGIFY